MPEALRQNPVIASEAKQSIAPRKERMDCFVAALLAMTEWARLQMMVSAVTALPPRSPYFIGQTASATAACGGEEGTHLRPRYLRDGRVASVVLSPVVDSP